MGKVLILGAGASYGHGVKNTNSPPTAYHFFDHPLSEEILVDYSELVHYIEEVIGLNLNLKGQKKDDYEKDNDAEIENLMGHIESTWRIGVHMEDDPDIVQQRFFGPFGWVDPVDMLQSYIVDLLLLSTTWLAEATCPYHDYLARDWLHHGDVVISFNYDLIIDFSLAKREDWHTSTGYGWRSRIRGEDNILEESEVTLLKLHGSLNWFKRPSTIPKINPLNVNTVSNSASVGSEERIEIFGLLPTLSGKTPRIDKERVPPKRGPVVAKSYSKLYKELKESGEKDALGMFVSDGLLDTRKSIQESGYLPFMILPSPYKPFTELRFAQVEDLWRQAKRALESADEVMACGLSFRDPHFNQLIREAARARDRSLLLKVVDPNEEVFEGTKNFFRRANMQLKYENIGLEGLIANLQGTS